MLPQNGVKQVGVLQGADGPRESAPPKKVTHMAELKTYVVRFGDADGVARTMVMSRVGDRWYIAPNSEQWAAAQKPAAPWMIKELEDRLNAAAAPVAKADTVDVMGAEPLE